MNKETLQRIKAFVLAISLCFSLGSCKKVDNQNENESSHQIVVFFIQDKALICDKDSSITKENTIIYESNFSFNRLMTMSSGVEVVRVENMDDAIELAMMVAGEENILYINYNEEDMQITPYKRVKK